MTGSNNNHLAIMALVAVVAVAGVVIIEQGTTTGMAVQMDAGIGDFCYSHSIELTANVLCAQVSGQPGTWAKMQCRYPGILTLSPTLYADPYCRIPA